MGERTCEWFALCDRTADGLLRHPVLGLVPVCLRCAKVVGAVGDVLPLDCVGGEADA